MNEQRGRVARRSVFLALIAMAALVAVGAALANGTQARSARDGSSEQQYRALLLPVPHNEQADKGSTVLGITRLEREEDRRMEVDLLATGLSPKLPHAIHIHGRKAAENECPRAEARNDGSSMPGSKIDGLIDVIEGLPDYGPILVSFTTSGDTSAASGLALDRFPVASAATAIDYERTIRVPRAVARNPERFHIVIHGLDLNNNGRYDGRIGPLGGAPNEATLPVACGEIRD
jgi:hypothetical protein